MSDFNFYPRPPRGGRRRSAGLRIYTHRFLSTPSARRATAGCFRSDGCVQNFYPRPPRGGRPELEAENEKWEDISIHALREEGDLALRHLTTKANRFLSTPSARRATNNNASANSAKQFLSTPSARRATAKTETKSLFSNKLYNILHEFRRALIYNGSKSYPNHAK